MFRTIFKIHILFLFFFLIFWSTSKAETINKIIVEGNQRISTETIKMFSGVSINNDLSENDLNKILKNLYNTNFFDLVSVNLKDNILLINVKENPIIQSVDYDGIKSSSILEDLKKNVSLKSRSSFNKVLLEKDSKSIKNFLKNLGYYFSEIDIQIEELEDNKINLIYKITLGHLEKKQKLKKFLSLGIKFLKIKN